MYKIIESPSVNTKQNFLSFSSAKSLCNQLEQDIFNIINNIRQKPSILIPYLTINQTNNKDNFEIEQVINYVYKLSKKNMSFPPLIQKNELTKISNELLNYIISLKNDKGRIKYELLENSNINLRKRAAPNIKIKGKYYEGIVLESSNIIEIIGYILKDNKGRNVLFNENIKYIGIACGIIENIKDKYNNKTICKICSIIDLVQDLENNYIINSNNRYEDDKIYSNITKGIPSKNKYLLPKCLSYDKLVKRKIKKKRKDHNIKKNTYDNIIIEINKNNSPLLTPENPKTPNINSSNAKIKSKKLFEIVKTPDNTELNKIYKNNSFYNSKYEKNQKEENATLKIEQEKKEIDNRSEYNSNKSVSFSKQKSRKKLTPKEKIQLLKQINQESRDKSKKKKSAIKIDEDSKSASFTNQKNNASNDASFSEISLDNDKKNKEQKINIDELKSELKKELKNEVKEVKKELKAEFENKMEINNKLKIPLLKLFLKQNEVNKNNDYSYDIGLNNNNIRETKSIDNYNNTNRSINSIDIFLPPNKNITSIYDSDNEAIPGLININSKILNNNKNNKNLNETKKENVIIKKLVNLNRIKSIKRGNKTPDNVRNSAYNNYNSPKIRKNNFIYHRIPFANNNLYCNNIKKKNGMFNLKINNIHEQKMIRNFNVINNPNILNSSSKSPRPTNKESHITFNKMVIKNINNDDSKGHKTAINKIIKIPKKLIKFPINNNIIINNKTNNIVYIKQTSPNRMKSYEMNNIYKKK